MRSQRANSVRVLGVVGLAMLAMCAAFLLFAVLWWVVPGPVVAA